MTASSPRRGLVVVGAGGFGREVYRYVLDCLADGSLRAHTVEFADDRPEALDGFGVGPLLGSPREVAWEDYDAVIAVGDPHTREDLASLIRDEGGRLVTLVHPTAYVAPGSLLGDGVVVGPFAFVSTDVTLGEGMVLNTYASVGHDCQVARNVVLSPYAVLNGNCRVGARTFLGTHATVTPGRTVGQDVKIAAGSVVMRDVPDGSLAIGNPAKSRVMYPR